MWRNFRFICTRNWNFSTCGVISNFSTWQMWRNLKFLHSWHVYDVENVFKCVHIMLFCWKMGFVVIYVVCRKICFDANLRTFVWRKIKPKIAYVEKNWQISGMHILSHEIVKMPQFLLLCVGSCNVNGGPRVKASSTPCFSKRRRHSSFGKY